MRRNRKSITTSPEIVEHIDGLTNAQFNLLTGLIPWLAENEKRQRKYMSCVLIRLSKIETLLTELLGVELVQFCLRGVLRKVFPMKSGPNSCRKWRNGFRGPASSSG
jgi:hypothetical protein